MKLSTNGSSSLTGRIWKKSSPNLTILEAIVEKVEISNEIAEIISKRLVNADDIDNFLNPKIKNLLPSPLTMLDMKKAADRIVEAITSGKGFGVVGDYDVDGMSSTSLMVRYCNLIEIPIFYCIPNRFNEGYGPSNSIFDSIIENGFNLALTLDCGSTSLEQILYGSSKGLDIIVIDHHQCKMPIPGSYAVVNPKRSDQPPVAFDIMAAVGITFTVLLVVNDLLKNIGFFSLNKINEPNLWLFLDLVALGSICDVVPVTGVNRAFIRLGLKIFDMGHNKGLSALKQISKIKDNISAWHLGFLIGPKINAYGRLGNGSVGVELLTTTDEDKAVDLAMNANELNKSRSEIERSIFNQAIELNCSVFESDMLIIASSNDWHIGVIGIVASRIKESLRKTSIIVSFCGKHGVGRASCRSMPGANIGALVLEAGRLGLVVDGGGHIAAAGFSVRQDKFDELCQFFIDSFSNRTVLSEESLIEYYDSEISIDEVCADFCDELEKILSPFGTLNPEPLFVIKNGHIRGLKILMDGRLLLAKFVPVENSTKSLSIVLFGSVNGILGKQLMELSLSPAFVDIIGKLRKKSWQGRESVEIVLEDIRLTEVC